MQPRALDRDFDFAGRGRRVADADEALVQMEQAQEIDEIAFQEPPAAQVVELAAGKPQAAQAADLALDLADVRRQVDACGAALEPILDLRGREMMQHDLHHRELVQVGVEQ